MQDNELAVRAASEPAALSVLTERCTPLVRQCAAGLGNADNREDLIQEGYLGLIRAVNGYLPSAGNSFSAYASVCVRNAMLSALRRDAKTPIPVGQGSDLPFSQLKDEGPCPAEEVQGNIAYSDLVSDMMETLTEREFQVCMQITGGATYAEAAHALHITPKAVDAALQRARAKLRKDSVGQSEFVG